jgi:hypothetical protein
MKEIKRSDDDEVINKSNSKDEDLRMQAMKFLEERNKAPKLLDDNVSPIQSPYVNYS